MRFSQGETERPRFPCRAADMFHASPPRVKKIMMMIIRFYRSPRLAAGRAARQQKGRG
jgi:hypothetical protein